MNIFRIGRLANIIIGAWLFLSALVLHRTPSGASNVALIGALSAVVALLALVRVPVLRFLEMPLAVWLFATAWSHDHAASAVANDLLAATMMFGFGAVPTDLDRAELRRRVARAS